MGWRYRKRVRVLPGLYLNFSKSGMSTTIGMKGFSVNIGQNGTYLNTGIPGTGLYNRVRLDTNLSNNLTPNSNDTHNFQDSAEDAVDIKSFQPELLTSESLFGIKESITKARIFKKELKEEAEKAINAQNKALFLVVISYIFIFGFFVSRFRENYKTCKTNAEEAENTYSNFKIEIDFNMDQSILDEYTSLKDKFIKLITCQKIWDITSTRSIDRVKARSSANTVITRKPVVFSIGALDFIDTKYEAFILQNANGGDFYIYPGFIVMLSEKSDNFAIIDYRDLVLEHNGTKMVESGYIPSDTKIVDKTWQYVNKNGLPDKRYKYNPEIPIALYYELVLKTQNGLFECYEFSNADSGKSFCDAFDNYQNILCSMVWEKA